VSYLFWRMGSSFLSGVILSQSGSLLQLGSRNLLASPSTLGIDGLAILWVLVFQAFSTYMNLPFHYSLFMILGLTSSFLLGALYSKFWNPKANFERIILLGITFNLLVGAIFSLCQFLFMAFNLPFPIELWFGHFRLANQENLWVIGLWEVIFLISYFFIRQELALFSLGTGIYKNWNLKFKHLSLYIFLAVASGTFMVVANFGAFSFLALVFPIISRKIFFKKYDLRGELIGGSLLNGLAFMTLDYLCYEFPLLGAEIPVGLIVTAVGAVSLITILWKQKSPSELLAKSQK
jgi:ABC-type Fe3+-siderophore transport system permease subunit